MTLVGTAQRAYRKGRLLRQLVHRELEAIRTIDMPLRRRLRLWSWGFVSESGILYDLTPESRHLYVSDAAYVLRTPYINGIYNPTLNDKVVFYHAMRSVSLPTPQLYGVVGRRRIAWIDPPHGEPPKDALDLLQRVGAILFKPFDGGRGSNVSVAFWRDGEIQVNGEARDAAKLARMASPGMMLCELIRPTGYAAEIFPDSLNTIRVMTMWDYERGRPFVARMYHRFGTNKSAPVDNVSRGGIMAMVDVQSGVMSRAIGVHAAELVWHDVHPDTGAAIEGAVVEGHADLVAEIERGAGELPNVPYIGWDVAVGSEGFRVIEGNSYPDLAV